MSLVCEPPSSVYLSETIFIHDGLNIPNLPTQPKPVHEGKIATLTIY